MFGPPGTGKSSYASALADKLEMKYLELTPGDFFSGGENEILSRINNLFEHILHLEDVVVFIDEIDDLVRTRGSNANDRYFDPRNLYVNTLLPRFQELNRKRQVILLMATNNLENVDSAIYRSGRIDLVIPIGALSPYGRLQLLYDKAEIDDIKDEELGLLFKDVLPKFLETSEYCTYSKLNELLNTYRESSKKITDILSNFNNDNTRDSESDNYKRFTDGLVRGNDLTELIRPELKGELTDLKTLKKFVPSFCTLFHRFYQIERLFSKIEDLQSPIDKNSERIIELQAIFFELIDCIKNIDKNVHEPENSDKINSNYYLLFHFIQTAKRLIRLNRQKEIDLTDINLLKLFIEKLENAKDAYLKKIEPRSC